MTTKCRSSRRLRATPHAASRNTSEGNGLLGNVEDVRGLQCPARGVHRLRDSLVRLTRIACAIDCCILTRNSGLQRRYLSDCVPAVLSYCGDTRPTRWDATGVNDGRHLNTTIGHNKAGKTRGAGYYAIQSWLVKKMNPPPTKKARLTTACNECRRRKVKCDANYPKCSNCCTRNSECFTSDPKRPDVPVVREWIEVPEKPGQNQPPTTVQSQQPSTIPPEQHGSNYDNLSGIHLPPANTRNQPPSPPLQHNHTPSVNGNLGTPVVAETTDVSPIQQPYDMSFNLDFVNNRFKMLGASSAQCLTKSLDIYLKSYNVEPVSALFRHGMQHAEEMDLPLSLDLIPFPDYSTRQTLMDAYFTRIHVYYPITDVDDTRAMIHRIAPLPDLKSVSYTKVPFLAIAYLLMSLGADEVNGGPSDIGTKYLKVGAALAGHAVNYPYLTTVQSLLLLAVCYRGRNKDGLGWAATGSAIRIAQSMGLHRHSTVRPSEQHGIQRRDQQLYHARIWAICSCLEKTAQLECGRPSAISVVNTDQMMASDQRAPGHDWLAWNMALAEVQHDISTHLYGHQPGERTAKQILLDTARLDKKLLLWPNMVPAELRPGNDILCGDDQFHFATILSFQYHQAVIAVHRAALIQPLAALQREIDKALPDNDARYRLRGGEAICVSSARAIARITIELLERKIDSRIVSAGPALLACVVLATYIVKNPGGRMQLSDLEVCIYPKCHVEFVMLILINSYSKLSRSGLPVISERLEWMNYFRKVSPPERMGSS